MVEKENYNLKSQKNNSLRTTLLILIGPVSSSSSSSSSSLFLFHSVRVVVEIQRLTARTTGFGHCCTCLPTHPLDKGRKLASPTMTPASSPRGTQLNNGTAIICATRLLLTRGAIIIFCHFQSQGLYILKKGASRKYIGLQDYLSCPWRWPGASMNTRFCQFRP